MKKVFRVLCEIDNGCAIEKYATYVFGFNEDEAKNVAAVYWEDINPNNCVCAKNTHGVLDVYRENTNIIFENEIEVIGVERVY